MLLTVVNPTDDGYYRVHKALVVHAMLTVETDGLRIVFTEHVVGVYRGVFIAKETIDTLLLFRGDAFKALLRLLLILLDEGLVDVKLLYPVLSWVLKLLGARHAVSPHRFAHLHSRIDTDTVVATQLLGIHATHGGADDQVGLLLLANVTQQGDGLLGMNGDVGSYDTGLGHHLAKACHRARLSTRCKAMTVQHGLAGHQLWILFDIGVYHHACHFIFNKMIAHPPESCRHCPPPSTAHGPRRSSTQATPESYGCHGLPAWHW